MADANWHRWRRLLWITGSHEECLLAAEQITQLFDGRIVWISDHAPPGKDQIAAHHASDLLGREISCLVFDAHQRFNPDALAAASGSVKAGGLALLLTPDAVSWPDQLDLDKARIAVHPVTADRVTNRFTRRFVRQLGLDSTVVRWSARGEWSYSIQTVAGTPALGVAANSVTPDQQKAIDAITNVVIGHRRRPALLLSDRGRGKSAALGIAAAHLISSRQTRIRVTAPRKSACKTLFKHALQTLRATGNRDGESDKNLKFIAPDKVIGQRVDCDLLIVDEAAGLPLNHLRRLLKQYPRIAFASTVHGYEGSGRGFALRFNEILDAQTPGWSKVVLSEPIRYAANDPLEKTIFQSLMLNASADAPACPEEFLVDEIEFKKINRDDLYRDEMLLRSVFGLLVMAHYRTRPLDLRQLLDGPNVRVWVACWQHRVIATALVCREGDIDQDLAVKIFNGERRPRGHLLAQTLVGHLGITDAATTEGDRIMRIVVHPNWRGRGIGSRLVSEMEAGARRDRLDWFGVSFGASRQLLYFWGAVGLVPIYVGSRREPTSGAHSVMMAAALSEAGQTLVQNASRLFGEKFVYWLAEPLRELEPAIVAELFQLLNQFHHQPADNAPSRPPEQQTDTIAMNEIKENPRPALDQEWRAFAVHKRAYEEALPSLVYGFNSLLAGQSEYPQLSDQQMTILIMKLLQKRSWKTVATATGLSGKEQVMQAMRDAAALLTTIDGKRLTDADSTTRIPGVSVPE